MAKLRVKLLLVLWYFCRCCSPLSESQEILLSLVLLCAVNDANRAPPGGSVCLLFEKYLQ